HTKNVGECWVIKIPHFSTHSPDQQPSSTRRHVVQSPRTGPCRGTSAAPQTPPCRRLQSPPCTPHFHETHYCTWRHTQPISRREQTCLLVSLFRRLLESHQTFGVFHRRLRDR